jgi:hypothetical protein
MFIISENEIQRSIPKNIKVGRDKIRMEVCLQTVDDVNRNHRRYSLAIMREGLSKIEERIREGSFIGELDHPIDKDPTRQVTVLYSEAAHRILDYGWDGNKLVGVLETLRTPKGTILKNLAEDGVPVGFSFRGMGELRQVTEDGNDVYDVVGPIHIVTWDSVGYPSHAQAKLIKVTESVQNELRESANMMMKTSKLLHEEAGIVERKGQICTREGVCYLPNEWDRLVEQRVVQLVKRFIV